MTPLKGGSKYIKRIIAGPHDTLKITNGQIFVNGKTHSAAFNFSNSEIFEDKRF